MGARLERLNVVYTGRGATFLVAANDASARSKAQADYVCDGTADDVEIQAAINALPVGGGRVQLSEGTFTIAATITMPGNRSGIHLAGMGQRATYIQLPASSALDAIQMGDNVTASESFSVRDLSILGGATPSAGYGINARLVNLSQIQNVRVEGCYNGIQVLSCVDVWISHTVVRDMAATLGIGINIDGTVANPDNNIFLSNVFIDRVSTGNALLGLNINCCDGFWWNNGLIGHCTYDIGVNPAGGSGGTLVQFLMFTNVYADVSGTAALFLVSSATQVIRSVVFTGCHFSGGTTDGILTSGAGTIDGVSFVGCEINGNGQRGINHASGGNIDIEGCHIAGNSSSSSGTYDAILVAAGLTRFAVRNCRIGPINNFANTQKYAINIATGASDRYVLTGNDVYGNVTGGISDGGSGTDKQIRHNIGYVTENSGASTGTGAQQTIAHGLGFTPTRQQIALTPGSATAVPYHSAAPGATNIYVTAANLKAWYWATVG